MKHLLFDGREVGFWRKIGGGWNYWTAIGGILKCESYKIMNGGQGNNAHNKIQIIKSGKNPDSLMKSASVLRVTRRKSVYTIFFFIRFNTQFKCDIFKRGFIIYL